MEKVKNHIKRAFDLISSVYVRGADADRISVARRELDTAFATIAEIEKTAAEKSTAKNGEVTENVG